MSSNSITMILFACFAFGLPLWAMQNNQYDGRDNHGCSGECYEEWKGETGGVMALLDAQAAARAAASPAELGQAAYAGCIACHGAQGRGRYRAPAGRAVSSPNSRTSSCNTRPGKHAAHRAH